MVLPAMSGNTPADENGTGVELTSFQTNIAPSAGGRVVVDAKANGLVSLTIASYDGGTLPGGTQAHAILTVKQTEALVDELKRSAGDQEGEK
jgi:hypothetical protein